MAGPNILKPLGLVPVQINVPLAVDPVVFQITSGQLPMATHYLIFGMMYFVKGQKHFWRGDFHAMRLARVNSLISANSVVQFPMMMGWDTPFSETTLLLTDQIYNFWDLVGIDGIEPDGGNIVLFVMPYTV